METYNPFHRHIFETGVQLAMDKHRYNIPVQKVVVFSNNNKTGYRKNKAENWAKHVEVKREINRKGDERLNGY